MENKRTIKVILSEMQSAVEEHKTLSPNDWINWALELASLWEFLKDELVKYEIMYIQEVNVLCEQGKKLAQAEREVKAKSDTYKMYRYLQGRDKVIEQYILLSKKRALIESTY